MAETNLAVAVIEEGAPYELPLNEDGDYVMSTGDEASIFTADEISWYKLVQPGSLAKNPELKAHVGKYYEDKTKSVLEQELFIHIGTHSGGRNRFSEYGSGNEEPLCKSFDGITPVANAEQPGAALCAECPYGDIMWKSGNSPECKEVRNEIFLDIVTKMPVIIPMKGLALGALNKFKRESEKQLSAARAFRKRVKIGVSSIENKPKNYIEASIAVIKISTEISAKGPYIPVFELVEVEGFDMAAYEPLKQYYEYKLIVEAAAERAAKQLEYEKNSTVGNQALLEAAPETLVELETADEEDEEFDV